LKLHLFIILKIDFESNHFLFETILLIHLNNNIKSKLVNMGSILMKRKADNPAFV